MAANPIPEQLAAACPAVWLAGPADAVAGVQPSFVAAPASTSEASAVLRAAAAADLTVVPRGTGSRLHWGTPPQRCDLVVEMTRMDRVIEHAAGDLTATVQAGVSLEQLADVLAAAGQRLALDPPASAPAPATGAGPGLRLTRGTIGGVLATGAAGPLRLRYGSPRDLLIGITVVRGDGTIARSGGKVVKNVAGYDLGKLFAGSRGTLGLITEATFRLHPVPGAAAYVTVECAGAADVGPLLAAAMDSPLAPVAAEIDWPAADGPVGVGIALEGDATALAERATAMADLLAQAANRASLRSVPAVSPDLPSWWGASQAADPSGTLIQIAIWPGDLGLILAEIHAAASAAGLDPAIGGSAAAGVLHAVVPPTADPNAVATFVVGLRTAVSSQLTSAGAPHPAGLGQPLAVSDRDAPGSGRPLAATSGAMPARASVVVLHAPPAVGGLVDLFGPVQSLGLMRAIKDQFDPGRRMAPGRFAGGI